MSLPEHGALDKFMLKVELFEDEACVRRKISATMELKNAGQPAKFWRGIFPRSLLVHSWIDWQVSQQSKAEAEKKVVQTVGARRYNHHHLLLLFTRTGAEAVGPQGPTLSRQQCDCSHAAGKVGATVSAGAIVLAHGDCRFGRRLIDCKGCLLMI